MGGGVAELGGLRADGIALGFVEAGEVSDLHGHALVFAHSRFMLEEKVPIQGGEWTGGGAGALCGIEATTGAVVAHALDVLAGRNVGFAGHETAVGVLGHAESVWQFDPFDGVDINGEIPLVDFTGPNAKHEGVEAGDHESLDVMRIAQAEGLTECITETGHVGVAGPVEVWKGLVGTQGVQLNVAGHLMPVDAADVFSPAEDLTDEAFDAGQRCAALFPRVFGSRNHDSRIQQLEVHGSAEARVEEPGFGSPHGVLPIAEFGKAVSDEVVQSDSCVLRGNRPVEICQVARVTGESSVDHIDHLSSDGIRLEPMGMGVEWRALFTEALAIFTIEVPLPTGGFAFFHEHDMTLAHFAVEELHAELFATCRVGCELFMAAKEVPVFADFECNRIGDCSGFNGRFDAPFTRFYDDPFLGFEAFGEFC